jgi:hypothetical protein
MLIHFHFQDKPSNLFTELLFTIFHILYRKRIAYSYWIFYIILPQWHVRLMGRVFYCMKCTYMYYNTCNYNRLFTLMDKINFNPELSFIPHLSHNRQIYSTRIFLMDKTTKLRSLWYKWKMRGEHVLYLWLLSMSDAYFWIHHWVLV